MRNTESDGLRGEKGRNLNINIKRGRRRSNLRSIQLVDDRPKQGQYLFVARFFLPGGGAGVYKSVPLCIISHIVLNLQPPRERDPYTFKMVMFLAVLLFQKNFVLTRERRASRISTSFTGKSSMEPRSMGLSSCLK